LKEFLSDYSVIGRNAKAILEEEEAIVQAEKWIAFWVLDHRCKEVVVGEGFTNIAKDLWVELNQGDSVYFILRSLNVRIPGKSVGGGVGDTRDILNLRIES